MAERRTGTEKIRCDACPVMCYIADGQAGACDRYANEDGRIIRCDPLTLLDKRIADGGDVHNTQRLPLRHIAENAGVVAAIVAARTREADDPWFGYDTVTETYGDLYELGVVDAAGVTVEAIVNAVSAETATA